MVGRVLDGASRGDSIALRGLSAAVVPPRLTRRFRLQQTTDKKLEEVGKKELFLIWDKASWHVSTEVRRWLGRHNRRVKRSGEGVSIVSCLLPKKSSWLNAIK
jgi:hypothetical protein